MVPFSVVPGGTELLNSSLSYMRVLIIELCSLVLCLLPKIPSGVKFSVPWF